MADQPDLDALIHDIIEDGSWSGADELEVMLVAKLGAALAVERARADQAVAQALNDAADAIEVGYYEQEVSIEYLRKSAAKQKETID